MSMYKINEVFYSVQGEGARSGSANVFVRFSDCNLACKKEGPAGFDCDTEFTSGVDTTLTDLLLKMSVAGGACRNVVLTGGEPTLKIDEDLISTLKSLGWYIAIETNGTIENPELKRCDWVCMSPKSAEHTLKPLLVDEIKYVRHHGQGIPVTNVKAKHYYISPAFDSHGTVARENLVWCIKLVKENPSWKLSVQQHKLWQVR